MSEQYTALLEKHAHLHSLDVESACMIDTIGLWIIGQLPIMMQKV